MCHACVRQHLCFALPKLGCYYNRIILSYRNACILLFTWNIQCNIICLKPCQINVSGSTIINFSTPLTSASLERSLHRVRHKFIHKSHQQQQIALTANHNPSACNAVKYAMLSKSRARQRFTLFQYSACYSSGIIPSALFCVLNVEE